MEDKKEVVVKYHSLTGQEVTLTPAIIKKYLVSGGGSITDQEIMMFLALCKYQNLNPFLREAYIIKYGTSPATVVVGKETFLKRAVKNPRYKGHETSISVDGKTATAKVYVEGYGVPISCTVDYDEYVGRTKEGEVNRIWKGKGRTMLKKCALVQALREAFPEDFGGMYSPEEINTIRDELSDKPIDMNIVEPQRLGKKITDDIPIEVEVAPEQVKAPSPEPQAQTNKPSISAIELTEKIKEAKASVHLKNIINKHTLDIAKYSDIEREMITEWKEKKEAELKGK